MKLAERWLPSAKAAEALGISKVTLRRWAEFGLLAEGQHYRKGLHPTSPWVWEVTSIVKVVEEQRRLLSRPVAAALDEGQPDG